MKITKRKHPIAKYLMVVFFLLCTGLLGWKVTTEPAARWTPDYPQTNITEILSKENLTAEEYHFILMQTGLGRSTFDILIQQNREGDILQLQQNFFAKPEIICEKNSPISWEESVAEPGCPITGLEDGDILITPCSHTFGWRNGHAALVINAQQKQTLESVVLGERSCIQSTDKWENYPAFLVLRLRGISKEKRAEIANNALLQMNNLPYGFFGDILEHLGPKRNSKSTHCSHLIWKSYSLFGFDIDGDGGILVTPNDIAKSPLLELVQVYGINPKELW